ncbi:redox-sensing transcriptional repressor Rex [Hydrogenibacillus schlegelii]|uniref:Redox-sensing transcriptional repressor Rex n=1 Tax=Hydrogenibacillus schlegelii TaxID=1484 RepID=A0A132NBD7_HYDSH|nr:MULTISPECIES: redox-sensing transcriptional repressor Rex [Hydrogenibacillus]KWX07267.1 REX family transcriptional regulator [Hydrogenibacillus schlegelii]MBE3563577.1 redox-sensing transcriptional repressor Rex [Hydrogenibacillus schlegelii]MBT9283626.1 redox-sensing transcriptional repressor Rex [Hydrogenibacillus schlegelii]OAR05071.1 REX family transcriptional regulator [Hydrogenibacillus schlegelii]PTQ54466.1 MAG: Redox-sensitive transcriptional regulator (AT-rich DNA-binding protein) 
MARDREQPISDAVIKRLPIYLRYLTYLDRMGVRTVSSHQMGKDLGLNPAQIRKDLAHFGEFGRKGIGYEVRYLIKKIRQILHLDQLIPVALVGAGHLGTALARYNAFQQDNMRIVAIFDHSPLKAGREIDGIRIQPMEELQPTVKEKDIRVGIITVPDYAAQEVADLLVEAGIEAILNFAPTIIHVPPHVRVHHADLTTELHSLAYYLRQPEYLVM